MRWRFVCRRFEASTRLRKSHLLICLAITGLFIIINRLNSTPPKSEIKHSQLNVEHAPEWKLVTRSKPKRSPQSSKLKRSQLKVERVPERKFLKDSEAKSISRAITKFPEFKTYAYRICGHEANSYINLMIVINSAVGNFEKRTAIRGTWGHKIFNKRGKGSVRLAFLVGSSVEPQITQQVELESERNQDVIQLDIIDNQEHLTYKALAILKWINDACNNTKYLLKAHDDTFINVSRVLSAIENAGTKDNILIGNMVRNGVPIRNPYNKFSVSKSQFPGDVFPDHLSGSLHIMSVDVSSKLFKACQQEGAFTLEDVLISGICAERANVNRSHIEGIMYMKTLPPRCKYQDAVALDDLTSDEMYTIFKELQERKPPCTQA